LVVFARLARKCNLRSLGGIYACSSRRLFCSVPLAKAICAFDKDNQRLAQTLGTPRPKNKGTRKQPALQHLPRPFLRRLGAVAISGISGRVGDTGI